MKGIEYHFPLAHISVLFTVLLRFESVNSVGTENFSVLFTVLYNVVLSELSSLWMKAY